MCGIAGVYEFGRACGDVSVEVLVTMRDTMHYRGPDDAGIYVTPDARLGLAHRRLAIIDPEGGKQPMFGPNGECLVFNGEIYNYPTLRRDLESEGLRFQTTSDTEVILKLYSLYGERAVEHLTGMFAFALWDSARGSLLLARDRIGEKPLYWCEQDGRLIFASEIKAILAHPAVTPAVHEQAIPAYLCNLTTPSPQTLYKNVHKLEPGTAAVCDERGMHRFRYWGLADSRLAHGATLTEASATVRRLLERSVVDRLMSDVPVGVLLSGGLDSTTLLALLREHGTTLPTFSVGFPEDTAVDERQEARSVANHFGTDHHEVIIGENDALRFLPTLIHHQDEPLADPVCVPLHFVTALARANDVKVVLAGEGSDELFWGYPRYRTVMAQWRWIRLVLALPVAMRALMPQLARARSHRRDFLASVARGRPLPMHVPLGLSQRQRAAVLGQEADEIGWAPSPRRATVGQLERFALDNQEYEFSVRLPELLLMRIDRFSMANSVEARVPFLDHELVEYVYRLPVTLKLHRGVTKRVLRDAVADLVPRWVLTRPKKGFGAPTSIWLRSWLGNVLRGLIQEEGIRRYFDVEEVQRLLHAHRVGGANNEAVLWPILNFALWHRYWIERERLEGVLLGQPTVRR